MNSRQMPNRTRPCSNPATSGFTLVELMVALVVFALIMVAIGTLMINSGHAKDRTAQNIEAAQTARSTLDYMARDIRGTGYGADLDYITPQPPIAYVDSMQIILSENQMPYPDTTGGAHGGPLAYDPAGSPSPKPLVGTQWTPPIKYKTGAELIRYTLDLNDDGLVDANDLATTAGMDARATHNPSDYVLVREVYGDSTDGAAGNNGGVQERVALVLKPGNSVPPMFTVYMKGSSTPWDWSNGPVPANQLQNIDRVKVRITASSANPDSRGQYPVATLETEINSMRNTPNVGSPMYSVAGYVYNDINGDHVRDAGDVGIPGATVQLGLNFIQYTNSSGFFQFRVPAGNYVLRQTPPMGFGSSMSPDTFLVSVTTSNLTYSFADTARHGGMVSITCFNDLNNSGVQDYGEPGLAGVAVALGGNTGYTNASGVVSLFSPPGAWSAQATVPDTMTATTPNPVTGSILDGGTASDVIGMKRSLNGTLKGTVFKDVNKNGNLDGGEGGIANVWVGATRDGGVTVDGYAYTDASGSFSITVPANDPPRTSPYTIYVVPPANYFPTTSTATGGVFVQGNATVTGYTFGMATYQVITVSANRVLSLASADLMEKDWNGNQTTKAHGDKDLVLGADAAGTDQISVWFNQYNSSPLFNQTPDYTRSAPQSVLSMALDTLDANTAPFARPDLVTGTKISPSGNFFVWFTQNTSGNEGYIPTTFSAGQNYRTTDGGDVQSVLTLDVLGGNGPDIIVGTKSPTANQGSIEVWASDDAATPTFSRAETYTTFGATSTIIGEVNGMALADLDNDGLKDLVVVTKTGSYSGQVLFFKNMGKLALGDHFQFVSSQSLNIRAGTAVATTDVNGDGLKDVIVGTQDGTSSGSLIYYRNNGALDFSRVKTVNAPGIVLSLCAADEGGALSINDLVVGWRTNTSTFAGGISIYYLDVLGLPSSGVDPSGGTIINMVPAVAAANFNYGTNPPTTLSPTTDLAVGVKTTASSGSLVIFIR